MSTVIVTEGLTRSFGGRKVVDRLDLSVPGGAIYALLGDNGAGKSTTIRMLTGLLPADRGRARILGMDCWADAITLRHRVGYVPEKPRFYDWMTVGELGAFTAGFHRPGFRERYLLACERFRLERKAKLKTLSKGGYAKVGLALALAVDPEVLILDEPTSGLDLFTRREFLGSMVELAADGRTILISSHAVAELERVASHVAFLAEGQLLLAGPLEDLRQRLLRVRVRHDGRTLARSHDPASLGRVLDHEASGREWQVVLQDANRDCIEDLRQSDGVLGLEESLLTLEEMYTSLLARFHRTGERNGQAGALPPSALALQDKGERR
jgi:ABC-2 type transport system ATP-binding protein